MGKLLLDHYFYKIVPVDGVSMLPTIDQRDNLILVDCFTPMFIRKPRRGEVIFAENPLKAHTVVKRV